jgi:hypothetical protein
MAPKGIAASFFQGAGLPRLHPSISPFYIRNPFVSEASYAQNREAAIMTSIKPNTFIFFAVFLLTALGATPARSADGLTGVMEGSSYYKVYPLFNPHPVEGRNYTVSRFGPVGIGIDLVPPGFTMKVRNVEPGSPAEGKLEPGQTIKSINGKVLKDIDPRMWLGQVISMAESSDGKLKMEVTDKGAPTPKIVQIEIPALGAYSETWPLNCPKSDKIVRNLAGYLEKTGKFAGPGLNGLDLLFMLSTGEEKDLEVARRWVKKAVGEFKDVESIDSNSYYTWNIAYTGPALCEYYLRTGDKSVMHLIDLLADYAKRSMYNGGWSHRGLSLTFPYMGGAHLNAAGVHVVTFLLLAKECGAEVDEYTLQTALKQFYRYAGRGNTPYGDGLPELSFVDNGKTGALAFTMAAAASLTPEGEKSIYAKARDISAVKSFYSTSWLNHGHTGGGIGEIWRGASMGLMAEKKPTKHREFMDNRQWFYDISRRFDGSFGIVGGGSRYDKELWGTGMALSYTIPRKTLRISGAPPSKHSKHYQLPERPWGNALDEKFYSLDPVSGTALTSRDVDAEKLETHGSWAIYRVLMDPKVSDKTLLEFAHHPDHGIRRYAVDAMFMHKRDNLILTLLKSEDPRARHAGTIAIYGTFKRKPMGMDRLTDDMIKLLTEMIHDPEESLWIAYNAIMCLNVCDAKTIEPHVDRLVHFFEHEEWWLSMAAMNVLNKVVTDPKYSQRLIPLYGKKILDNRRAVPLAPLNGFTSQLKSATPEVQKLGAEVLGKAYAHFPTGYSAPGGVDMHTAADFFQRELNRALSEVPGGLDVILTIPKRTSVWQESREDSDLYSYDGKFKENKNLHGKWTVIDFVPTPGEFNTSKKMNPGNPPFKDMVFEAGGKTNSKSFIWSGKNLIDLSRNQMLLMEGKSLDEEIHLFIEAGGFTTGEPKDWHPGWLVLKQMK